MSPEVRKEANGWGGNAINKKSTQERTLNLNWIDKKFTTKNWLGCFEINSMFRTSVHGFFPDLSRGYNMVPAQADHPLLVGAVVDWNLSNDLLLFIEEIHMNNTVARLWPELARGSSYRESNVCAKKKKTKMDFCWVFLKSEACSVLGIFRQHVRLTLKVGPILSSCNSFSSWPSIASDTLIFDVYNWTPIIIHSKYFPNSDWLKARAYFTITSYWWPNLEEFCA